MSNKFQGRPPQNKKLFSAKAIPSSFSKKPSFSFAHLSRNKDRNFDFFKKSVREKEQAYSMMLHLLMEVSDQSILILRERGKQQTGGYETLPQSIVNCQPHNLTLYKDEDIYSFRFGTQDKYRMLCIFDRERIVFDVIGFDWDFSAYPHGN